MSREIVLESLQIALAEASNYITDKLVLESLVKNGSVSLEEANFFDSLVKEVLTEAAEDFVPDALPQPSEPILLTDEAGNQYMYQPETGELVPVAAGGEDEVPADEASADEAPADEAVAESTEVQEEAGQELTESTQEIPTDADVETDILTENQAIVSNIIKSLSV